MAKNLCYSLFHNDNATTGNRSNWKYVDSFYRSDDDTLNEFTLETHVENYRKEFAANYGARYLDRTYKTIGPIHFDTSETWHQRESARENDGLYCQLPWHQEAWSQIGTVLRHYAHTSIKDPGKVAFTPSPEYGARDRQTTINPGRYLARFYSEWLTQSDIAFWCEKLSVKNNNLSFAKTSDEIEAAYTDGLTSCMTAADSDGVVRSWHASNGVMPVRVYGAGDLAIAVLRNDDDHMVARAICWPDKLIYGRQYGDENRLQTAFAMAGYRPAKGNDWHGAKLFLLRGRNRAIVCPYLDIDGRVTESDDSKYLVVGPSGYSGDSTAGIVSGSDSNDDDEDQDDRYSCDNCGDRINNDETFSGPDGDNTYCESCYDDRYTSCSNCGEAVSNDDVLNTESGNHYCERSRCRELAMACNDCGNFYEVDDLGCMTTEGNYICNTCAERPRRYFVIESCGHYHPSDPTEADRDETCDCGDEINPLGPSDGSEQLELVETTEVIS